MMNTPAHQFTTAAQWWRARRRAYNYGLLLGGAFTLLIYALICTLSSQQTPLDLTLVGETLLIISFFYLIYIGIANVCYGLGYLADRAFNHRDSYKFRTELFAIGYWTSVCFPGLYLMIVANLLLI